jgi:hypothetical protein
MLGTGVLHGVADSGLPQAPQFQSLFLLLLKRNGEHTIAVMSVDMAVEKCFEKAQAAVKTSMGEWRPSVRL